MSEEYKWRVGIDTEPASRSFEDLAAKAGQADDALIRIAETVTRLEQALNAIGKGGGLGDVVSAINIWGESITGSVDKVVAKLDSVQSTISRVGKESQQVAGQSASAWGQGATSVERYSERLSEAQLQLVQLRKEAEYFGGKMPTFAMLPGGRMPGAEAVSIRELIPSLQEYERLMSELAGKELPRLPVEPERPHALTTDPEQIKRYAEYEEQLAQVMAERYQMLGLESKEAQAYVMVLKEIAEQEARVAQLTQLEQAERQKALAFAREQAMAQAQIQAEASAMTPEGRMASFFTESKETDWSTKYGLGSMTGFEQSMLKVLTTFDQLRSVASETNVTFTSIIQVLEQLGTMRFTGIGTSLRANIRDRLEESVAATFLLIQALEQLNAMQTGVEAPEMRTMMATEPVGPRTNVGYWAGMAGAPTAQVVTEMTTMSEQAAKTFDTIPPAAERMGNRIIRIFERIAGRVVKGSIVPDMVRDINAWLAQIGGMGALSGIEGVGQKFLEIQREMQNMMLFEKGGLPGFGEQRAEIINQWIAPYRDMLQQAHGEMATIMQQAGPAQWQQYTFPTGQQAMVPPSFIMQQSQREMEAYEAKARTLTSSEKELSDTAHTVANSIMAQAKASRTKIDILKDLSRGTISAKDAEKQLAEMTQETERSTEKATALSGRFMRHITWIFQGIAIWGGIRAIRDLGEEFIQTFSQIEMAATQTAFIVGQSVSDMVDAQRNYAAAGVQYGVGPQEMAPAQPIMAQFGVQDSRITEMAAQLSMVTGEQISMADATKYLLSITRRWNISIDDTSHVLDTLVTMYANAPGDMKSFLDLMAEGPSLARQMGQSFEENMLLVARAMSYLPGQTAAGVSGTMGRILTRVYQQSEELTSKYKISLFDPETLAPRPGLEVLDQIAAKFRELESDSEKAALATTVGGIRGGQAWQDTYDILANWQDGIRGVETAMKSWSDLSDATLDTHQTKLQQISAAWDNLWQTIISGEGVFGFFTDRLDEIYADLMNLSGAARFGGRLEETGLTKEYVFEKYREETGKTPSVSPLLRDTSRDFLDWFDDFVDDLGARGARGGRGYATAARTGGTETFSKFKSTVDSAADKLDQKIQEASGKFSDEVEGAGEDFRKNMLVTMLAGGWTPGTGVVDLSKYSMAEINRAMSQSRTDTQRMISGYREFLQGQGLGGEAIEKAMANFTNKLMLQLQFFRLPGGQIRLMEGRDLLFYLSKIEENTRPLEGIWNVPEGMRVWVPIESTFYGDWRKRQEEGAGEEGQEVTLDSSAFEAASSDFGNSVRTWANSAAEIRAAWFDTVRAKAEEMGSTGVYFPEAAQGFGWPYSAEEELPAPWLPSMEASVRSFGNHVMQFGNIVTGDETKAIFDPTAGGIFGLTQDLLNRFAEINQGAGEGGGRARVPYETHLPVIIKGIMEGMYPPAGPHPWQGMEKQFEKLDVQVPEPLGVTVPVSETAQGVALGTINTGMPSAMTAMQLSMGAMASSVASQLYYLMMIASNTAQVPTVNVYGTGEVTASTEPATAPASTLMTQYQMSPVSHIVPI